MAPAPNSPSDGHDERDAPNGDTPDGSSTEGENDSEGNGDQNRSEASPEPGEIRLARISVTRTGHGMALDVLAGKLRIRLYIDAQWADLVKTIAAGEGELNQFVPFRMAPLEVEKDTRQLTPRTLEARRIPELSSEHPLFGTPLWNAIFPSEEPPAKRPGLGFDEEDPSGDSRDESSSE